LKAPPGQNCDVAKIGRYIALLGLLFAAAAVAAGFLAAKFYGPRAYQASAVAAGINWFAGSLALVVVGLSANQPWRLHGALLGMSARMGVALVAVVYFLQNRPPLTNDGVVTLILVHYIVGLLAETALAVRLVACSPTPVNASHPLPQRPQSPPSP